MAATRDSSWSVAQAVEYQQQFDLGVGQSDQHDPRRGRRFTVDSADRRSHTRFIRTTTLGLVVWRAKPVADEERSTPPARPVGGPGAAECAPPFSAATVLMPRTGVDGVCVILQGWHRAHRQSDPQDRVVDVLFSPPSGENRAHALGAADLLAYGRACNEGARGGGR